MWIIEIIMDEKIFTLTCDEQGSLLALGLLTCDEQGSLLALGLFSKGVRSQWKSDNKYPFGAEKTKSSPIFAAYFPLYAKFRNVRIFAIHCKKSNPKFRDITWNVEEKEILRFPHQFYVISRKVDYLWDSVSPIRSKDVRISSFPVFLTLHDYLKSIFFLGNCTG